MGVKGLTLGMQRFAAPAGAVSWSRIVSILWTSPENAAKPIFERGVVDHNRARQAGLPWLR